MGCEMCKDCTHSFSDFISILSAFCLLMFLMCTLLSVCISSDVIPFALASLIRSILLSLSNSSVALMSVSSIRWIASLSWSHLTSCLCWKVCSWYPMTSSGVIIVFARFSKQLFGIIILCSPVGILKYLLCFSIVQWVDR